jgi:hypothetical protein
MVRARLQITEASIRRLQAKLESAGDPTRSVVVQAQLGRDFRELTSSEHAANFATRGAYFGNPGWRGGTGRSVKLVRERSHKRGKPAGSFRRSFQNASELEVVIERSGTMQTFKIRNCHTKSGRGLVNSHIKFLESGGKRGTQVEAKITGQPENALLSPSAPRKIDRILRTRVGAFYRQAFRGSA